MSPEERSRRGRQLCERLAADVAAIAPRGIGAWERAWDIVAGADADFVIALSAWERTEGETELARVRLAYDCVLAAWKDAVSAFQYEQERTA